MPSEPGSAGGGGQVFSVFRRREIKEELLGWVLFYPL